MTPEGLFDVRYDWDTGTWGVFVYGLSGVLARRTGFDLETDAQESLTELKRMLAGAPNGAVESVLLIWENRK